MIGNALSVVYFYYLTSLLREDLVESGELRGAINFYGKT